MKGRIITDIGQVSVDTDVIAKYAGMAAVECFGVVGMAMTGDEIAEMRYRRFRAL